MRFDEFKESLYKEKSEIIINKAFNVQGKEITLLTFSADNDFNRLWTLIIGDFKEEAEGRINEFKNNREFLIHNNLRSLDSVHVPITSIEIQGHKINIDGSSASRIDFVDKEVIKHFLNLGLLDMVTEDTETRNIIIISYDAEFGQLFPIVNIDKPLEINMDVDRSCYEELIGYKFKAKVGECEKGKTIKYINKYGEEEYFYINSVTKIDLWEQALEGFERIKNNENLSNDDKNQIIEDYKRTLQETCPKGKLMLTIEYETPDNSQLHFLTKEYLEKPVEFSSKFTGFMTAPSNESGKNGNIARYEYLIPIDNDYNEEVEIELFSKYIENIAQRNIKW